jgi:cell division protein FtsB
MKKVVKKTVTKKLPKAQVGGHLGFGNIGKHTNTVSEKEMTKRKKEYDVYSKKRKIENDKHWKDLQKRGILKAGVSKNKK